MQTFNWGSHIEKLAKKIPSGIAAIKLVGLVGLFGETVA